MKHGFPASKHARRLLSIYTIRLNHRQKLLGHVFSGRYKAVILGDRHSGQLRHEGALAKAQRIMAEELKRAQWKAADFMC